MEVSFTGGESIVTDENQWQSFICYGWELNHKFSGETHRLDIQWNLLNPPHQGTGEMCRIVHDVRILWFYFS